MDSGSEIVCFLPADLNGQCLTDAERQALFWLIRWNAQVAHEYPVVLHCPHIESPMESAFQSIVSDRCSSRSEEAFFTSGIADPALNKIQTQLFGITTQGLRASVSYEF
jgi:hypothetical protein